MAMKKTFYIGAVIIVGVLLLQTQFRVSGRTQAAAVAQGSNVVVQAASPREPVQVTRLQVGGNDVALGNPFAGDENWVNALVAELKNTSDKTITDLRMSERIPE